jgi:hypothetical protein
MTSYSVLYFADDHSLPAPLPTAKEIESATQTFGHTASRKVVGVGAHFVVKYEVQVDSLEGKTMFFLAQSTSVSVPRVYALYQNPTKKTTYIIMERIQGRTLAGEWPFLNSPSKKAISIRFRKILKDM